jgi:hypothetical protein
VLLQFGQYVRSDETGSTSERYLHDPASSCDRSITERS